MFSRSQKRNSRGISKAAMDVILQAKYDNETQSRKTGNGGKTKSKPRIGSHNIFSSKSNAVHPNKVHYDSFHGSELQLSSTESDMTDDMEIKETKTKCTWKSAIDKKSGKTYYYNTATMESTWEKPPELSTTAERLEKEMFKRNQKTFFKEMESNIVKNLASGFIPGCDTSFETRVIPQTKMNKHNCTISPHDIYYAKAIQHSNGVKQNIDLNTYSTHQHIAPAVVSPERPVPNYNPTEGSSDEGIETIPQVSGNVITSQVRKDKDRSMYSAASELGTQATIRSICTAYRAHIIESTIQKYRGSLECSDSFNDCAGSSNLSSSSPLANPALLGSDVDSLDLAVRYQGQDIPSLDEITRLYTDIFTKGQMEVDCIAMTLIYVERLIKKTHSWLRPTTSNWRSLLLICTIMASKVWDDISMINADFANICNAIRCPISLQRINELELSMLQRLKFRVIVSSSEYTKYNLFIRSLVLRYNHGNTY